MADFDEPCIGDLWSAEEARAMDAWCEESTRDILTPATKNLLRAKYGIIFREDTLRSTVDEYYECYPPADLAYEAGAELGTAKPALVAGVSTPHQVKLISVNTTSSLQDYLNKPLPPIPATEASYTHFIGSREGCQQLSTNSIDNLSFDEVRDEAEDNVLTDSASSLPDLDPVTPPATQEQEQEVNIDLTAIHQLSFLQAGIHLGTKDIVDNHFAALGTGLAGHLEVDEADQLEKEKASIGFYGGFKVEESPSQFHAPIVDQDSGYGDIREGAEDFPELWTFNEKQPKAIPLAEAEAMEYEAAFGYPLPKEKVLLQPKSQKAKIYQSPGFVLPSLNYITGNNIRCSQYDSAEPCSATWKAEKRGARDSFVTRSMCLTEIFNDDELQYLGTKRIRGNVETFVNEVRVSKASPTHDLIKDLAGQNRENAISVDARTSKPSPTYSLISDMGDQEFGNVVSAKASRMLQNVSAVEVSRKGFHGQFTIFDIAKDNAGILKDLNHKARRTGTMCFGDRLHPNYVYVNNAFALDLRFPDVQYTTKNLRQYGPRHFAIVRATDLTEQASSDAISKLRTASQENLRKESHTECSSACLEGVSVGRYRYYQGHLGVEEYNQAGLCVCWDICACTKMCSRYGDLICPCADNIVIQKI